MPKDEGEEELSKILDLIINPKKDDKGSYNYNLFALQILKQAFKNVTGDD